MKWFIKTLRHYADFSGRARRKEYWMFVLFNVILSLAWSLLATLLVVKIQRRYDDEILPFMISLSWLALMALPGMAVTVRRLHDVGKSGWMMLVALIPVIGGIWMLALMLKNGQDGENRFGPDPKTSPEAFGDKGKLTSVGVALIVVASISCISNILVYLTPGFIRISVLGNIYNLTVNLLLLAAGIMLLNSAGREKARPVLVVLMIAAFAIVVRAALMRVNFSEIVPGERWRIAFDIYMRPLLDLFVALFAAAFLFLPQYQKLVRCMAGAVIVLAGICLLWCVSRLGYFGYSLNENIFAITNALTIVSPVAFILLVWTFISKKEHLLQFPATDKKAVTNHELWNTQITPVEQIAADTQRASPLTISPD